MFMTMKLFTKHCDKLTDHELTIMRKVIQRLGNTHDFISENNLSHALVKIEPVQSDEAVTLFGQSIKSLAFSRISLYTAAVDEKNGGFIPDVHLFSGLISEQALCNLTLNMNRTTFSPMTVTEAMGEQLDKYSPASKNGTDLVEEELNKRFSNLRADLLDTIDKFKLASEKPNIGVSAREEFRKKLDTISSVASWRDIFLKEVMQNLERDKSVAQTEISNCINSTYNRLKNTISLPGPSKSVSRQSNIMFDALSGYNNDEERQVILKLVKFEQQTIVNDCELIFDVEAVQKDSRAFSKAMGYSNGKRSSDYAEDLGTYRNKVENPSILEDKSNDVVQQVGISASRVSGDVGDLFSEYNSEEGTFYEFEVANAYSVEKHGSIRIVGNDRILTFRMMPEDLMNALRGFVNGGYVQCSISRFANCRIEVSPYLNARHEEISTDSALSVATNGELKAAGAAIIAKLSENITRKIDKQEILEMLEALPAIFDATVKKETEEFDHYSNKLKEMVTEDVKRYLANTQKELKLGHDSFSKIAGLLK